MPNRKGNLKHSFSNLSSSKRGLTPPLDYGEVFAPGSVIADRYEIAELVGYGGMGVVYKGLDREATEVVALKMIRPGLFDTSTARERFVAEGMTTIGLRHPNIVGVRENLTFDEKEFIVMDFIEGPSLREALAEVERIDVLDSIAVMLQILDALICIHGRGIVHRDLKPENILIDVSPYPVHIWVTDFGISKNMTEPKNSLTGSFLGTPDYSAPEQDKDASRVDARADLFSLGIVFYELLTGRRPKGAWAPPTQLIPDIPPGLDVIVEKLLQPDPATRYHKASKTLGDLGSILGAELMAAGRVPKSHRAALIGWLETRERGKASEV
ncbi:MAG: serine/threonine-protein kinase [Planctomycetota bacterium]|jgi:serine/threonine protein kinase